DDRTPGARESCARSHDPGGHAHRGRAIGNRIAHDGAGANYGMRPDDDAIEDFDPGPQPGPFADADAGRRARLIQDRARRIAEVVIAADEVAVGGDEHVPADVHAARRKNFAVESDVDPVGQLDIAVLARENRVAPDECTAADADAGVRFTFGVDQAVVVDDDVVGDADFVRMAQHDV